MEKLISVKNLKKYFKVSAGTLKAVDDVSFDIYDGETFGLVGESGCGKSTCGRTLLRLYEPTGGEVFFNGENICGLSRDKMTVIRKSMQMIFQDPYASLDPRMPVEDIVAEPLDVHGICKNATERHEKVVELLKLVGLGEEHASRFPHEFSGGQRQRVGIARALALNPKFIVCDEPISALDVSIQAQVVNLLKELQNKLGLTYLFIAHDLSMVRYISDRVGVMYLGKMVEIAESNELYDNPIHPYTSALLSAIPIPDPDVQKSRKRIVLEGDVPSPINPKPCCRLKDRCAYAIDICSKEEPVMQEIKEKHFVACHRAKEFVK
ncbi:oligopeptide/dipeptide ABC transporter, ATP-binding protein domain [Peptoanaerobacter stomatis]|uniref:Oligopeptide/dipeptide ABC transporter, ATP-binding protein domain n=1 Tax=Peptoanaerobacter stomatis TaxID=796937 RepID=V9HRL8_9FIRM|nr:oligopeptide/dipeptide ABC transporter ATP-binding protein [Peptoanaerobacter stomatis]EHL18430.1 oligopeptide/dipeptide ABC transporter, ATP-binding protein domain [Peptoanaerobacter stomatis]